MREWGRIVAFAPSEIVRSGVRLQNQQGFCRTKIAGRGVNAANPLEAAGLEIIRARGWQKLPSLSSIPD